ncbi:MAG: hypothetical protein OEZ34_05190 [Spirochaetia bacterium]|nr:hypothetical protein [Spirochaetia bacterium]
MKSFWIKLEIRLLSPGIISVAVLILEIIFWKIIPESIRIFFSGGETGGIIIVPFVLLTGAVASLLFD